ncbi:MAG: Tim44 domain-containing protein [Methyloversatilis sp.]|jgi:predicted lipid-binding transport protein (Tim44 family)|nr:Tim44 domain-containing protein [Methyloversatilis sp.]MBP6194482.1 Tim44 domain-containing protein [Methyloversatilis sp.]MBP9116735.1 Tim44 domain-containing protein [Methyloversatilis sp.]
MKKFVFMLFAAFIGFSGVVHEAEAKRLGGGKSFGSQRDSSVMKRDATPAPTQNSATAQRPGQTAGAVAQPAKRSWMGPLAGIAAGLGLAALASHLGFGEEMASFMMIALLVVAALFLWRMFAQRKAGNAPQAMQYASAGAAAGSAYTPPQAQAFESAAVTGGGSAATAAANIPADFDVAGFLRQAKLNFVRLQAANDSGDVEDIRSFTSPEVFAEIRMQLQERGTNAQHTDVVQVDAVLLDVSTEGEQYVASVRFYGLVREDADASPESFDEVWHLSKPVSGERGWLISGIQQME